MHYIAWQSRQYLLCLNIGRAIRISLFEPSSLTRSRVIPEPIIAAYLFGSRLGNVEGVLCILITRFAKINYLSFHSPYYTALGIIYTVQVDRLSSIADKVKKRVLLDTLKSAMLHLIGLHQ